MKQKGRADNEVKTGDILMGFAWILWILNMKRHSVMIYDDW